MKPPDDRSIEPREPLFSRAHLLDPAHLILIPAVVILWVASDLDVIAPEPLWLVLGALLLTHVAASSFAAVFPPGTSHAKPLLFLAVTFGLAGLLVYIIGWGAVLAVVFVACAAATIQRDGSRYGIAAMVATIVTIIVGEVGVALGIFISMIPGAAGHGLAFIEAAVTVFVIGILARGQRQKEQAESRERATDERFRALVQYASDAILVFDDDGVVMYASPAAEHLLPYPPGQLERFDPSWVDPDHVETMMQAFARMRTNAGGVESMEIPIRRPDGTSRWVEVHVTNLTRNPAVGGYVCNIRDIGERRVAQQQLQHDANHDPLTRLPNRRHFLEHLDRAWSDATPDDLIAVLFIDVDHFKHVNDQLGHAAGDQVLHTIASSLARLLRPGDVIARFGGDEFTVLLAGLTRIDGAIEIADRITRELFGPRDVGDNAVTVSVSVGVAASRGRDKTAEELLKHADEAMYRAKRNGRARWESYDQPPARVT